MDPLENCRGEVEPCCNFIEVASPGIVCPSPEVWDLSLVVAIRS